MSTGNDDVTFTIGDTTFNVPASAVTLTTTVGNTSNGFSSYPNGQYPMIGTPIHTIASGNYTVTAPWVGDGTYKVPCQHVTGEYVEYIDGTVYANCTICTERIQLARIPGGLSLEEARYVVSSLTAGEVDDELLTLLNDLVEQLEANTQALQEFAGLVDVARQMVRERCE